MSRWGCTRHTVTRRMRRHGVPRVVKPRGRRNRYVFYRLDLVEAVERLSEPRLSVREALALWRSLLVKISVLSPVEQDQIFRRITSDLPE